MNSKKYMIISVITLIIAIIGSSITYAWYTWSTGENEETRIVTNLGAATIFYNSGSNIEGVKLKPTETKEEGIVKTITVKSSKNTAYKLSFNLYLDILELGEGLKDSSFKYALYKDDGTDPIKSGSFTEEYLSTLDLCETNNTPHIVLVDDETITTTKITYKLYIWIDGTVDNPSSMESQEFSFKLHADGQNAVLGETLAQHISNLYTDYENKTTVTNNEIDYYYADIYDTDSDSATAGGLMNDRLGGAKSLESGIGNIRYYGQNPNNYIDIGDVYETDVEIGNWVAFGGSFSSSTECYDFTSYENLISMGACTDDTSCQTFIDSSLSSIGVSSVDELCGVTIIPAGTPKSLYRIIGLFKDVELSDGTKQDLVKVVREDSIGDFAWDTSSSDVNSGWGINQWGESGTYTGADLMKLLNPGYSNNTDLDSEGNSILVNNSLYYNSGSGTCYYSYGNVTITCDFTYIGLSSNVHDKIETVKWNLGGHDSYLVFPNDIYGYERDINVVQNPSDGITRTTEWFGKIALLYPSDYGYGTDFTKCIGKNLYSYNDAECYDNDYLLKNDTYLLLTPYSSNAVYAWYVSSAGEVNSGFYVSISRPVFPVFYLTSDVGIVSGLGTEESPYIVR